MQAKISFKVILNIILTFLMVDFAWIFFRANNLGDAWIVISKIFTNIDGPLFIKYDVFFYAMIGFVMLFFKDFTDEFFPNQFKLLHHKNVYIRIISMAVLLCIIILLGIFDSGQFIYFQF